MSKSKRSGNFFVLLLLLLVTACGTTVSSNEFNEYINDRNAQRIAIQVCLPDKTAFFDELSIDVTDMPRDISYEEKRKMFKDARNDKKYVNPYKSGSSIREYEIIRQWRAPTDNTDFSKNWIGFGMVSNVKGIMSDGAGAAYLSDSTETNQAVFFEFTHERPSDVIAIHISVGKDRNGNMVGMDRDGVVERRIFWFKAPKDIKAKKYTAWAAPLSEEGPSEKAVAKFPTFWLLTHNKDMPIYAVTSSAPRIRYTLLSNEEYYALDEKGRRAKDSASLQRTIGSPSSDDVQIHLIPKKENNIPSC